MKNKTQAKWKPPPIKRECQRIVRRVAADFEISISEALERMLDLADTHISTGTWKDGKFLDCPKKMKIVAVKK